jgi:hypothetical protein
MRTNLSKSGAYQHPKLSRFEELRRQSRSAVLGRLSRSEEMSVQAEMWLSGPGEKWRLDGSEWKWRKDFAPIG